ncbi:hypothetical protein TcCL_Unassigned00891 [Trypanosoma cruzi]|nr:hypothetical protein TcCL_Unassigned00891 [Trypanosoma cruzi]
MRKRTAQRRRSAHLKGCGPPQQSQPTARITPAGRVTCRALPLSSPPSLHAHGGSSSHTQPPAHATKEASKSTAMCILCVHVVVCACRHTRQRSENRSRACEGTHKQNVQQRCMAEITGLPKLMILHCSPSSGNS